ncbi:MAG: hypothetical protein JXQ73_27150 [Phycisphaerae bacterium]|nr:hypothetical protein [Phycisphaerae bacterium]
MERTTGGDGVIVGQRLAFAAVSLTLGICSFISLLGMEKAALAIVFGVLATRGRGARPTMRLAFARLGMALGALYITLLVVLMIAFREDVIRFFEFIERFDAGR